jgi:ubiquinol-cytochrome c reductase cytochrome b subunit
MAGRDGADGIAIVEDAAQRELSARARGGGEGGARGARTLALEGVPPAGGRGGLRQRSEAEDAQAVQRALRDVPHDRGPRRRGGPEFDDYGSKAWLTALVRDPRSKRFYGGTKAHTTMEALPVSRRPRDEQLAAVVEYMRALSGPELGATDAALVAKGKELWDSELECSGCHEVEAGKDERRADAGGARHDGVDSPA